MKTKGPNPKPRSRGSAIPDQMVVIGFGLAAIFWLLDSFLSIFTSYDNFLEDILGVQLDNIWGRILVLCLFAIFGSHAQYTINERKQMAEKMERDAALRERFRRLFSPDLAEMVVSGELTVEQGGENRFVTVMFVDIRGFTALSSDARASDMLQLLNDYYEMLVEIVFKHNGTVDKFMGDGMMVVWGAPITHKDDAVSAVNAAMSIQKAIEGFNFDRLTKGLASIEAGIGINTGFVVAGYIGSSRTMSYSVIGDTVNIASRLCAAARPGEIVISEQTHTITADHFVTRPHAPIVAKGKAEPMQAFTVIGARHRGPRPSAPLNPSHELQTTRL
jgi:adenylate cyclase